MAKKNKTKTNKPQEVEAKPTADQLFMEQKHKELNEYLVSNRLALQPLLLTNEFGIRPTVRLVRVPENIKNE